MSIFTRRLSIVLAVSFLLFSGVGFGLCRLLNAITSNETFLIVAAAGYGGILALSGVVLLAFRGWLAAAIRQDFMLRAAQAAIESRVMEVGTSRTQAAPSWEQDESFSTADREKIEQEVLKVACTC